MESNSSMCDSGFGSIITLRNSESLNKDDDIRSLIFTTASTSIISVRHEKKSTVRSSKSTIVSDSLDSCKCEIF